MNDDPIVAEIRRIRRTVAKEHGNNIRRIAEALRIQEQESDRKLLDPGPKRRLKPTGS
jgi:hypothetical protein